MPERKERSRGRRSRRAWVPLALGAAVLAGSLVADRFTGEEARELPAVHREVSLVVRGLH